MGIILEVANKLLKNNKRCIIKQDIVQNHDTRCISLQLRITLTIFFYRYEEFCARKNAHEKIIGLYIFIHGIRKKERT